MDHDDHGVSHGNLGGGVDHDGHGGVDHDGHDGHDGVDHDDHGRVGDVVDHDVHGMEDGVDAIEVDHLNERKHQRNL